MWREGILVIVCIAVALQQSIADPKDGVENGLLLQRLKRSPYVNCDPQPPPPPPLIRPQPPPPPSQFPPPPPPQGPPRQERNQRFLNSGCSTCGGSDSSAISNANSNSGDAIAVAVAKASG